MTTQRVAFYNKGFAPVITAKRQPLEGISKKINPLDKEYNLDLRQVNDLTMTSNGYTALNTLLIIVGVIILVPLAILVSTYAIVGFLPLVVIGLTLAILAARKDSEAEEAKAKLKWTEFKLKTQ
jgi:hypothetical protein